MGYISRDIASYLDPVSVITNLVILPVSVVALINARAPVF